MGEEQTLISNADWFQFSRGSVMAQTVSRQLLTVVAKVQPRSVHVTFVVD